MATITIKGRALATRLRKHGVTFTEGDDYETLETACSLISRHAVTYLHIQTLLCNEVLSDSGQAYIDKREAQIEYRIRGLVARMRTDYAPVKVIFEGDPRGHTVKFEVRSSLYNTPQDVEIGVEGS